MFSSDLTWTPMADDLPAASRKNQLAHRQESSNPPQPARGVSRASRERGDGAESSRSSGSSTRGSSSRPAMKLFRWGRSKHHAASTVATMTPSSRRDDTTPTGSTVDVACNAESHDKAEGPSCVDEIAEQDDGVSEVYSILPSPPGVDHPSMAPARKSNFSSRAATPSDQARADSPTLVDATRGQSLSRRQHMHGPTAYGALPSPTSSSDFRGSTWTTATTSTSTSTPEGSLVYGRSMASLVSSTARTSLSMATTVDDSTSFNKPHAAGRPLMNHVSMGGELLSIRGADATRQVQALIRRMSYASPSARLSRVTEAWAEPLDAHDRMEIEFEKELWLLAELVLRDAGLSTIQVPTSTGWVLPVPATKRCCGILDVATSPAEVLQLATLQPGAAITYIDLSSRVQNLYSQPANVTRVSATASAGDALALPVSSACFDHVRLTVAAGILSPPQLKSLLRECYRVLSPRGLLEFRFVDLSPRQAGPEVTKWMEAKLSLKLESAFRCTRPALLIPMWVEEAGFELLKNGGREGQCQEADESDEDEGGLPGFELAVCVEEGNCNAETAMESLLCQFLLQHQYPQISKWFWEIDKYRNECKDRGTKFSLVSLFGYKAQ